MPTPTNNELWIVDAAGIDWKIMLLPGEVSITTSWYSREVSITHISCGLRAKRTKSISEEVSRNNEGGNFKSLQILNGSPWGNLPSASHQKAQQGTAVLREKMKLIDRILAARNLTDACKEVVRNKGAGGVDGMSVKNLKRYLDEHRQELIEQIHQGSYQPKPVRGKEIPKGGGKYRLLGIPTVIDRMLQQAVSRTIMPQYEYMFSCYSFGYRPKRNTHQAIQKSLGYINSGFQHIAEIDLKGFFDEVDHALLLQILYRKIKCKETMRLLRRWLRVPIELDGKLVKRRKGVPQGSPISPLLSNIILHRVRHRNGKIRPSLCTLCRWF